MLRVKAMGSGGGPTSTLGSGSSLPASRIHTPASPPSDLPGRSQATPPQPSDIPGSANGVASPSVRRSCHGSRVRSAWSFPPGVRQRADSRKGVVKRDSATVSRNRVPRGAARKTAKLGHFTPGQPTSGLSSSPRAEGLCPWATWRSAARLASARAQPGLAHRDFSMKTTRLLLPNIAGCGIARGCL